MVATALTVYAIETRKVKVLTSVEFKLFVATALTVYGIETIHMAIAQFINLLNQVATALTVYGIETELNGGFGASVVSMLSCNSTYRLRY